MLKKSSETCLKLIALLVLLLAGEVLSMSGAEGARKMPDFIHYEWNPSLAASFEAVEASQRGLRRVPAEMARFANAKALDLSGNELRVDAEDIKILEQLKGLEYLNLGGNKITDNSIIKVLIAKFPKLRVLYLGANQLTELSLPKEAVPGLEELGLNSMKITEIPDGIEMLTGLQELDLSFNRITRISPKLGELPKLRELFLIKAGLTDDLSLRLPTSLRAVHLPLNNLTAFCVDLRQCRELSYLDLCGNPIREIPSWITELVELKGVFLRNTEISEVDERIAKLAKLEMLDVAGSRVKSVGAALQPLVDDGHVILRYP